MVTQVNVKDLSLDFGHKVLFDKLSFCLQSGDKITVVGDNGTGKSTLIKLLAGEDYGQSGQINVYGKIGYLPQSFEDFVNQSTLDHLICTSKKPYLKKLTETPFAKRASDWFKEFNSLGGNVLLKTFYQFGFTDEYFERDFFSLSGGEKVKIHLSGLAHAEIDILLLDEPTNHLDLVSLEQIENQLLSFSGVVIAVSHDRYFIKKVATKILQLETTQKN